MNDVGGNCNTIELKADTSEVIRRVAETEKPEGISLWVDLPGGRTTQMHGTLLSASKLGGSYTVSIQVREMSNFFCDRRITGEHDAHAKSGKVWLPADLMYRRKADD